MRRMVNYELGFHRNRDARPFVALGWVSDWFGCAHAQPIKERFEPQQSGVQRARIRSDY